jgi:hypothetical protein
MSLLAVSDSSVDCPEQSAPCPSHTFKKTAAINAIIAKVLDNAFNHLVAFRLNEMDRYQRRIPSISTESKPNALDSPPPRCPSLTKMRPVHLGLSFFPLEFVKVYRQPCLASKFAHAKFVPMVFSSTDLVWWWGAARVEPATS